MFKIGIKNIICFCIITETSAIVFSFPSLSSLGGGGGVAVFACQIAPKQ